MKKICINSSIIIQILQKLNITITDPKEFELLVGENIFIFNHNTKLVDALSQIIVGNKISLKYNYCIHRHTVNLNHYKKIFNEELPLSKNIESLILNYDLKNRNLKNIINNINKHSDISIIQLNNQDLETFSSGVRDKLFFFSLLFLNFDCYLMSEIPKSIDLETRKKLASLILKKIKNKEISFIFIGSEETLLDYFMQEDLEKYFFYYNFKKKEKYKSIRTKNNNQLFNDLDLNSLYQFSNLKKFKFHKCKIIDKNGIPKKKFDIQENIFLSFKFNSGLTKDFKFKINFRIENENYLLFSFNEPVWRSANSFGEVDYYLNLPINYKSGLYKFYMTLKSEKVTEQNCGRTVYLFKEFNFANIKLYSDFEDEICELKYITV